MSLTQGSFPLQGTGDLPNVTVAFRGGEHWSNRIASGSITPGEAVVPVASGGKLAMRTADSGDSSTKQVAIALRPEDVPDVNTGPNALGPNEIVNQTINEGEYVHAYYPPANAFHLTLVDPNRSYEPSDLIGWDADGARPAGKDGVGSWAPDANADIDSVFEVMEVREVGDSGEVILTVRDPWRH